MGARSAPLLHREDPDKDPLVGHTKVTRADWMNLARDVLVNEGAGEVKILRLSQGLGVSRSSFYGYFASRAELLAGLLAEWEARNTAQVIAHCAMPAASITQALCQFFLCFVDPAKFDRGLDRGLYHRLFRTGRGRPCRCGFRRQSARHRCGTRCALRGSCGSISRCYAKQAAQ